MKDKATVLLEQIADALADFQPEASINDIISITIKELKTLALDSCPNILSRQIPRFNGETCLHLATRYERLQAAQLLLKAGANVNATNMLHEKTPLHLAAELKNARFFLLFCNEKKMDVNLLDINKENALHICIKKEFIPGINILLTSQLQQINLYAENNKAAILIENIQHDDTKKAIKITLFPHDAVINKDCKTILEYLDMGLPVNRQDKTGKTMLHHAAENGCADILLLLLNQPDILVNIQNNHGYTAMDLAVMNCAKAELTRLQYQQLDKHQKTDQIEKMRKERLDIVKILINSGQKFQKSNVMFILGYVRDKNKKQAILDALAYISIHKKSFKKTSTTPFKDSPVVERAKFSLEDTGIDLKKLNNRDFLPDKNFYTERRKDQIIFQNKIEIEESILYEILWNNGLIHQYAGSETDILDQKFFESFIGDIKKQLQNKKSPFTKFSDKNFLLIAEGINEKLSDDNGLDTLVKQFFYVYIICQGQFQKNRFIVHPDTLYHESIGLLRLLPPLEILKTILLLTPVFTKNQWMVSHILVKNILLLNPYFGYDLKEKNFITVLNIYFEKIAHKDSIEPFSIIKDTLDKYYINQKISPIINDNLWSFSKKVNNCIHGISNDLALIAYEIDKLTIDLYKNATLKNAFGEKAIQDSHQTTLLQLIDFIKYTILSQKDFENCGLAYKFWLKIAEICLLNSPFGPNLCATNIIMGALISADVSRVKDLFPLSSNTQKLLRRMTEITRPNANQIRHRTFMREYPETFPLISYISSYDIQIRETGDPHKLLSFIGELYKSLIHLKQKFECVELASKTNFMQEMTALPVNEETLDQMSWVLKPNISDISKTDSLGNFDSNFSFFKRYRMQLTVRDHERLLEGNDALLPIEKWLNTLVENKKVQHETAEKLLLECKTYVKTKIEGSPVIKKRMQGNRSVSLRLTETFSPRQKNSLYVLPKSPRLDAIDEEPLENPSSFIQ